MRLAALGCHLIVHFHMHLFVLLEMNESLLGRSLQQGNLWLLYQGSNQGRISIGVPSLV